MSGPRAVDSDVIIGMEVLVYRERPVNKWTGPVTVTGVNGKMVRIYKNSRMYLVSIEKVKQFKEPIQESILEPGTQDEPLAAGEEATTPEKSKGTRGGEVDKFDPLRLTSCSNRYRRKYVPTEPLLPF